MSALEAFVNEQKKKGNLGSSASFSSFGDLRSKLAGSVSIGKLSVFGRGDSSDTQALVDDAGGDGQLPTAKNRKNGASSFFGFFSQSDEGMCGMSRTQRLLAFFMCLLGAIFCFSTAAMLIPVLLLSTRKFAALNTLGSAMLVLSFAFLWGPAAYLKHLLSPQRRLVTVTYFSALLAALYSSLWLKSTVFTLIASVLEAFSLIWFIMSYVPGGERGLRFITGLFTGLISRPATAVLPI